MQPSRRIASNGLLTAAGEWKHYPIVTLTGRGVLLSVEFFEMPDWVPFTEFRAGVLVVGLTREAFERVADDHSTSLDRLLTPLINPELRCVAHLAGWDYEKRTLTESTTFDYL